MPETDVWTIGRLLQWTTDYLKQHGSESPRLDAEVLLAAARGCDRIELYTAFGEAPPPEVLETLRDWVRRRAQGTPVAYLVGHREFYSLSFEVTPAVLIPRPETEFVVLTLLDLAKPLVTQQRRLEIADIGTGSGIIAICAAKYLPGSRITAADTSPEALKVAGRNAERHDVSDRVRLVRSDLLTGVDEPAQFDIIASNPPYLSEAELEAAPADVRNYEPHTALVGGPTGIEIIRRLVDEAGQRLRGGGWLIFEIGPSIETPVRQLLSSDQRYEQLAITNDLARLPRVVRTRRR